MVSRIIIVRMDVLHVVSHPLHSVHYLAVLLDTQVSMQIDKLLLVGMSTVWGNERDAFNQQPDRQCLRCIYAAYYCTLTDFAIEYRVDEGEAAICDSSGFLH
eukprot:6482992-Amphidinium_carterae.3